MTPVYWLRNDMLVETRLLYSCPYALMNVGSRDVEFLSFVHFFAVRI